jgi:polar amino acid transport system substrate-binding protein
VMRIAAALALLVTLSACQGIPADPDGTLDAVTGGTLRVGVTHNPPWTEAADAARPSGTEVALVEEWAADLDADITWTVGSESVLVDALDRGELDLVIGGFRADTPWLDRAALTAPYAESEGADGAIEQHVMLARLGENRFLVALETFLGRP